jgi:hypothetical protein
MRAASERKNATAAIHPVVPPPGGILNNSISIYSVEVYDVLRLTREGQPNRDGSD